MYDVVIVGGGPAGLSAALALGRARKRVLLCDAGPRRNARAERIHNFVTRDGTPPDEFRATARQQLATYPNVEVRDVGVESIAGARGAFQVRLEAGAVKARRIILCTGMVDEMLPIEGFAPLWGHAIFQCPYCHGWETQDRRWGYLARAADAAHVLPFLQMARAWTGDLTLFTDGPVDLTAELELALEAASIKLETAPIAELVRDGERLTSVSLKSGERVACDVLFVHPPQHHVALVRALGVALDDAGYVRVDAMTRETSVVGVYAAGDRTSRMQAAIFAASSGNQAATMINLELTREQLAHGRGAKHGHGASHHPHHGAEPSGGAWSSRLDGPERDAAQRPDEVAAAMTMGEGMTVADIGAGTGYFEAWLSRSVGAGGKVLALDVDPERVAHMRRRFAGLDTIEVRQVEANEPGLADGSVDRVLVVDVWHHLDGRIAYARKLRQALTRDGKIIIVDYRLDAPHGPPQAMRLSPEEVIADLAAAGLTAHLAPDTLPDQFVIIGEIAER